MTHTRRHCCVLLGAGFAGLLLAGAARADDDPRNEREQFHRFGIDQQSVTVVTRTGHYDFMVAIVTSVGNPDSALMSRRAVSPDQGILYTVPTVQPLGISNRGVPFPTDILYISGDGRVMEVRPSIMANDNRVYTSLMPVKAALQVIAGTVVRIAAAPGDYVLHQMFGRTL